MALIECPECTAQISDQAESCIHCGLPIESIEQTRECPECGTDNAKETSSCENCGFPLEKEITTIQCPECKKEIPENISICDGCGFRIDESASHTDIGSQVDIEKTTKTSLIEDEVPWKCSMCMSEDLDILEPESWDKDKLIWPAIYVGYTWIILTVFLLLEPIPTNEIALVTVLAVASVAYILFEQTRAKKIFLTTAKCKNCGHLDTFHDEEEEE